MCAHLNCDVLNFFAFVFPCSHVFHLLRVTLRTSGLVKIIINSSKTYSYEDSRSTKVPLVQTAVVIIYNFAPRTPRVLFFHNILTTVIAVTPDALPSGRVLTFAHLTHAKDSARGWAIGAVA
jgi:hypothetical protein